MASYERVYVWDRITRIWHWLFAASVITGWLLGEFRDFDTVQWHFYCGYAIAALIAWRLVWGFAGPSPVRFGTFISSLGQAGPYLSRIRLREPSGVPGHNPIGVLSVLAMLLLIGFQVFTGLFVEDDSLFAAGPLTRSGMPPPHLSISTLVL